MTKKTPPKRGRKAPPKRPSAQKGQVKHSTTIRKGSRGPVVHHEDKVERLSIPVEPGEESASVGYDIKYWASDQNHGMTIGTSAHVKVSCQPDGLDRANDVAADLAWEYMERNAKRAKAKIMDFVDGKEV
jgi:hypothetical protein